MDMVMPEMDGMQATQVIRTRFPPPLNQIPVLAVTASTNPVDHDRCLAARMNDVVHKPLEETQLMAKISSVLATQAMQGDA